MERVGDQFFNRHFSPLKSQLPNQFLSNLDTPHPIPFSPVCRYLCSLFLFPPSSTFPFISLCHSFFFFAGGDARRGADKQAINGRLERRRRETEGDQLAIHRRTSGDLQAIKGDLRAINGEHQAIGRRSSRRQLLAANRNRGDDFVETSRSGPLCLDGISSSRGRQVMLRWHQVAL